MTPVSDTCHPVVARSMSECDVETESEPERTERGRRAEGEGCLGAETERCDGQVDPGQTGDSTADTPMRGRLSVRGSFGCQ